jgi:hypothetical protein
VRRNRVRRAGVLCLILIAVECSESDRQSSLRCRNSYYRQGTSGMGDELLDSGSIGWTCLDPDMKLFAFETLLLAQQAAWGERPSRSALTRWFNYSCSGRPDPNPLQPAILIVGTLSGLAIGVTQIPGLGCQSLCSKSTWRYQQAPKAIVRSTCNQQDN